MVKVNKKGRAKHFNFIGLPRYVHQALAWKCSTPYERVIYIEIRAVYRGGKNQLSASVRWLAAQCGISKNSAEKAIRGLEDKGLIARVATGHLGPEGRGVPSVYRLTDAPDTGQPATMDFLKWKPPEKQ